MMQLAFVLLFACIFATENRGLRKRTTVIVEEFASPRPIQATLDQSACVETSTLQGGQRPQHNEFQALGDFEMARRTIHGVENAQRQQQIARDDLIMNHFLSHYLQLWCSSQTGESLDEDDPEMGELHRWYNYHQKTKDLTQKEKIRFWAKEELKTRRRPVNRVRPDLTNVTVDDSKPVAEEQNRSVSGNVLKRKALGQPLVEPRAHKKTNVTISEIEDKEQEIIVMDSDNVETVEPVNENFCDDNEVLAVTAVVGFNEKEPEEETRDKMSSSELGVQLQNPVPTLSDAPINFPVIKTSYSDKFAELVSLPSFDNLLEKSTKDAALPSFSEIASAHSQKLSLPSVGEILENIEAGKH